jgi:spermidine/putrescine transport system substrate-binding protein
MRSVLPAKLVACLLGLAAIGVSVASGGQAEPAAAAAPGSVPAPGTAQAELVFLTWPDYIDPDLVAEFEAEHGVDVRFTYFDSDDARDRVVAQSDGRGFDLLLVDNTAVDAYRRRGWIAPLDQQSIPGLRHLDPRFSTADPGTDGYAVPYFWGTIGIAYRADLLDRGIAAWMALYRPDAALAGRIMMLADSYDLIGMALKALGYSMNSTDPDQIDAAIALVDQQKPAVARYGTLSLGDDSALLSGEVVAAMTYNGDAAMLRDQQPAIRYRVPDEGCAIWTDFLAVGASGDRALASAFIDFLNQPEHAARNAQYLHYATPNRAAEALLPEGFRDDPLVYPPREILARCEHYQPLPAEAMRRRSEAYAAIVYGR